ncbi:peptidase C39 [Dechloromonas denitrificans]|uniref:Peptidase C39 n=2 Tax=Dechloromonas denitrificans TaxID=281362 RepID=A0A133XPB1_9RHOO|nr:peptidase C39 [Dechloromonas denitrificans]
MKVFPALLLLFLLPSTAVETAFAAEPSSRIEMPIQSGGAFSVPVTSMRDVRFRNTLRQKYDFSCGSAALATLLTHHYSYSISEQDVFQEMYERGDKAKIRKEGFSLLDMKAYLDARGFQADGFVADVEQLQVAGIPAIALVKENGYFHFVVVKGLREGRILIGDPSSGTRAMPQSQFKEMWVNRILFVIRNKTELAKFNADADWRVSPRGPVADGVYRGAAESMLPKRGPNDF